jgi:hypothetical protein
MNSEKPSRQSPSGKCPKTLGEFALKIHFFGWRVKEIAFACRMWRLEQFNKPRFQLIAPTF